MRGFLLADSSGGMGRMALAKDPKSPAFFECTGRKSTGLALCFSFRIIITTAKICWDMSMMELPSGAVPKSTLNPNAPLFIPMAFKQVQDFSPEWWELVKTTTWFREHWFHMHHDQETFDADEDEDVANLLPDSIDLEIGSELSMMLGAEAEQVFLQQSVQEVAMNKDLINLGFLNDADAAARGFGSRASKNGIRTLSEPAKYHEKPVQRMSPKFASRHFIQQPR